MTIFRVARPNDENSPFWIWWHMQTLLDMGLVKTRDIKYPIEELKK